MFDELEDEDIDILPQKDDEDEDRLLRPDVSSVSLYNLFITYKLIYFFGLIYYVWLTCLFSKIVELMHSVLDCCQ